MKKKFLATMLGVFLLVGCSSTGGLEITIPEYKGLEIDDVELVAVSDEDVESSINSLLESQSTTIEVTDRAVQDGDVVNIDYVGKVDGVAFDGGTAQGQDLEIGSGTFIDGFESGLVGATIGSTVDVQTTFPDEYENNPDLAGVAAVFTVTVNSISQVVPATLDDAFVQANSTTSTTVDEFRAEVKTSLEEQAVANRDLQLLNAAWTKLLEGVEVTSYPQDRIDELMDEYREQEEATAETYGLTFDEYLAAIQMSEEDFEAALEDLSKDRIMNEEVVNHIVKEEGIENSEEELEEFAVSNGFESYEAMTEQVDEEEIQLYIFAEKVNQLVLDNAKLG